MYNSISIQATSYSYIYWEEWHTHTHEFHLAKWRHWPSATASPMFHSYPGRLLLQSRLSTLDIVYVRRLFSNDVQYHPPTTSLTFRALLSRIIQGLRDGKVLYTDHHLPCHPHLGTLVVTGSGQKRHPDSVLTSSLPAGMPVLHSRPSVFVFFFQPVSIVTSLPSILVIRWLVLKQIDSTWNINWACSGTIVGTWYDGTIPYLWINTFHASASQQLICPKSIEVLTESSQALAADDAMTADKINQRSNPSKPNSWKILGIQLGSTLDMKTICQAGQVFVEPLLIPTWDYGVRHGWNHWNPLKLVDSWSHGVHGKS